MILRKIRTIKRGWSDDECWNLDYSFIEWLNKHLKVYKKDASRIVDLEYHKFTYKRKKYTQLQLIDKLIELTDEYIKMKHEDWLEDGSKYIDEIFDIFKLIYWSLWW